MLRKSLATAADEIVVDLEDAVTIEAKDSARDQVVAFLGEADPQRRITVRVNAVGTAWCHLDLIALAGLPRPPASIVVPKVESAGDIAFIERLVAGVTGQPSTSGIRLQALIESAAGLVAVDQIATAGPSLEALILGYADLAASLGRSPNAGAWDPARERLLWAARAAGLRAVDGPHLGVAVDEGFDTSVTTAVTAGFDAKWLIHPDQIAAVNVAFTPSEDDISWATRVLDTLAGASDHGTGAVALDGAMLDEAVAVNARRILSRAGAI